MDCDRGGAAVALRRWIAAVAILLCALAVRSADVDLPHRGAHGFVNPNGAVAERPFSDLLRWKLQAWREGLPLPAQQPTPVVPPQLALLRANTDAVRHVGTSGGSAVPSATWIGHATVLVQSGGLNILTDPVFSERASPVSFVGPRRAQPPGIALADLPPIDVVLISHNHYDHLDKRSVQQLDERAQGRTLFLVPLGLKAWFADIGIANVIELDWWEHRQLHGVEFELVPAQHWSERNLMDRDKTLWGGWAVFAPDLRWYFSGDSGYSPMFAQTREKLASRMHDGTLFDLALLAIGAYEPRWFMGPQHMNPAEAVRAHKDLAARRSLGVHWGTFQLTDEALDQPPRDLAAARAQQGLADDDFFVLPIGGTWWLGGPPALAAKQ
jgi:N-acyl-phosphatidylethanolamine-hydrolysing phospholipase D